MYCNKCGAEIKNEKSQFCGACGAPVKRPEENAKMNQSRDGGMRPRFQKSDKTMPNQEQLRKVMNSYPRNSSLIKRIAIGGCIAVVLVVLFLVGGHLLKNKNSNKGTNGIDLLSQNIVSVDNLSARPITIYGYNDNVDYSSSEGSVIEASIKNNSDDSLDVKLVVEATVEYADNYGDKQTAHVQIYISSEYTRTDGFHCPYSREFCSSDGLLPVGLAPKEEKTVRYYFEANNYIYGYDVDNNNQEITIRNGTITDVKLIDASYDYVDCVYVSASEWKDQVKIEQSDESFILVHKIREYLAGEIVNNTKSRWKTAELYMDVQVDGQGYYDIIGADASYIGVGKSFSFDNVSFMEPLKSNYLEYSEDGHKIEFIPALMYYIPE